jgi:hypothetical protein
VSRIEAICPACGPVVCAASEFMLSLCSYPPASHYAFCCPSCTVMVTRPATPRVAQVLLELGVSVRTYDEPLDLPERPHQPERHVDDPSFTAEDVIELRRSMEDPNWIEQLGRAGNF